MPQQRVVLFVAGQVEGQRARKGEYACILDIGWESVRSHMAAETAGYDADPNHVDAAVRILEDVVVRFTEHLSLEDDLPHVGQVIKVVARPPVELVMSPVTVELVVAALPEENIVPSPG
ncbi:hypothetical protein [Inquilinus sp. CA228]|uniref:hypothetical protein n=1 Tax=Inquilinus sp. CA228 TaxID=3455609 RepID=UPI003F8D5E89